MCVINCQVVGFWPLFFWLGASQIALVIPVMMILLADVGSGERWG